ncbi:uncharacterized protein LOC124363207 isoform X1 [Homalodisca vitripennis]|uniref:uncharacterized protein LOC124363207 isoform X1 n=1 Tax=Homalodisca vitripennis TaxID=197043 RepID=UPI001EEB33FD|nr:uncharacterized protein LOC124363207 isoform X1 [Homalodisca vitripennis]
MLIRSLLLLGVCLVTSQLLCALPLEPEHPETLLDQENDQLSLESTNDAAVVRDKRTVGFLRQAFPTLSQIIDRKIQAITRLLFRLIGRLVLRGGGGGGGGGTAESSDDDSDRRIQITLPTFPPSADEDEDEDEDEDSTTGSSDDSTTTTTEPSPDENLAESRLVPVVVRRVRQAPAAEEEEYEDEDQDTAATGDNEVSQAEDDAVDSDSAESETNEDDPRNKRFLNLGGSGGSGGSGGGSGNFLFDIIRRSADRAARMAGTVYRVLAGTDDVGLPTYPPITSNKHTRAALVAGSGTTQNQDEADNAPLDETNTTHSGKADDGYSAGVPGPLTRLFVIANRGIANLIQDLILRLAQTSERIVNFKARLITSII